MRDFAILTIRAYVKALMRNSNFDISSVYLSHIQQTNKKKGKEVN